MHKNKTILVFILIALVVTGMAFQNIDRKGYKNLQILPKDISPVMLDSIMDSYNKALGVNCKFCHEPMKAYPDSLDYASDAVHMKEEARRMMRMNIHINVTYFYFDRSIRPEYLKTITCNTCHRGEPFPEQH